MTSTIAMSYASSINPRNWEAIAIFVCFDNFSSAIRTPPTDFVPGHTYSEGPTATGSRFTVGAYGLNAYKSGQKCSTRRFLLRWSPAEDASLLRVKERHWIGEQVNLFPGWPIL
jgi:hypothetical protein